MTIQVIRIQAPQYSSKGQAFLEIEAKSKWLKWSFLSTSPIRRKEMRKRGATHVVNPFQFSGFCKTKAIWLDEWQSFMGVGLSEMMFELFSDQGVELIILSQSFRLRDEFKLLSPWLKNVDDYYYTERNCPASLLSSSCKLVAGLRGFARDAYLISDPYEFPIDRSKELLIPFDVERFSHLLSLSRHYQILAFKGPRRFYFSDILLWWLGGHPNRTLIGSGSENQNRRNINKEGALSRPASHWRVSTKKWQTRLHFVLRRARGR
jgi:hypothetical protein